MSNQTDPRIQAKLDEVQARFEKRLEEIKSDGTTRINEVTDDSLEPNTAEVGIDMTFEIEYKTTSIRFDIPKFSSELQKIIFDIPTSKMELKKISWTVPATKMERRCVSKRPVTTCKRAKPSLKYPNPLPKCTVTMECIYMDVPVVYQKPMEIKVDMPVFSMKKQELSFDKPIITFETIEIKLKLPQFHLRDLSADLQKQEDEYEEIGNDMETQVSLAKNEMDEDLITEIGGTVDVIFDEIRKQLIDERGNVSKQFDDAIGKMKSAIKILKENNATSETPRLESELAKLVEDYKTVLNEIDLSIEQLNQEQLEVINSIKLQ